MPSQTSPLVIEERKPRGRDAPVTLPSSPHSHRGRPRGSFSRLPLKQQSQQQQQPQQPQQPVQQTEVTNQPTSPTSSTQQPGQQSQQHSRRPYSGGVSIDISSLYFHVIFICYLLLFYR